VEKFKKLLGSTYFYSENRNEIPTKISQKISKAVAVDFTNEGFICISWMENFLSKGDFFVLVTKKRIIVRDPIRLEQNTFADITGIEQDFKNNIALRAAGNSTQLFHSDAVPAQALTKKLLTKLNEQWIETKNKVADMERPNNTDTFIQIEKLAKLYESGIISESEFTAKKTELLSRV
jgi:hypothetical protein